MHHLPHCQPTPNRRIAYCRVMHVPILASPHWPSYRCVITLAIISFCAATPVPEISQASACGPSRALAERTRSSRTTRRPCCPAMRGDSPERLELDREVLNHVPGLAEKVVVVTSDDAVDLGRGHDEFAGSRLGIAYQRRMPHRRTGCRLPSPTPSDRLRRGRAPARRRRQSRRGRRARPPSCVSWCSSCRGTVRWLAGRRSLGIRTMPMRAHDRLADHGILVADIPGQVLEHALLHAGLGPPAEPARCTATPSPNRSGRLRHGRPARKRYSTAPTNVSVPSLKLAGATKPSFGPPDGSFSICRTIRSSRQGPANPQSGTRVCD